MHNKIAWDKKCESDKSKWTKIHYIISCNQLNSSSRYNSYTTIIMSNAITEEEIGASTMKMETKTTFQMKWLECLDEGSVLCLTGWCLPCVSQYKMATKLNIDNKIVFCILPLCCRSCSLTYLLKQIIEKRDLTAYTNMSVFNLWLRSFFDCCFCLSCRGWTESKVYYQQGMVGEGENHSASVVLTSSPPPQSTIERD